MKRAQIGIQYLHYKKAGLDLLKIEHTGNTVFADSDRQRISAESRSLQRVRPAPLSALKKNSALKSRQIQYRRPTATSRSNPVGTAMSCWRTRLARVLCVASRGSKHSARRT